MRIIPDTHPDAINLACEILKTGGVIAFATDTIYGIATDATNEIGVEKLYQLKKRDAGKPIAIFLKNIQHAKTIFTFDDLLEKTATTHMPGPITIVAKVKDPLALAPNLNKRDDHFLGFRIIKHDFVTPLLEKFNGILAVTSANISGAMAAENATQISDYFNDSPHLDLIIDSGELRKTQASTVVKIVNNHLEILRQGVITHVETTPSLKS